LKKGKRMLSGQVYPLWDPNIMLGCNGENFTICNASCLPTMMDTVRCKTSCGAIIGNVPILEYGTFEARI
jgi:hypothetical protein